MCWLSLLNDLSIWWRIYVSDVPQKDCFLFACYNFNFWCTSSLYVQNVPIFLVAPTLGRVRNTLYAYDNKDEGWTLIARPICCLTLIRSPHGLIYYTPIYLNPNISKFTKKPWIFRFIINGLYWKILFNKIYTFWDPNCNNSGITIIVFMHRDHCLSKLISWCISNLSKKAVKYSCHTHLHWQVGTWMACLKSSTILWKTSALP